MNFVLMADELYKKGIDGSLSRCLGQNDQNIALGEVHNGICGAHQAGKKMRWVLYCNHVYWPSMIKDCIDYAKACLECQKHGSIQQIPASELHSIIKPWPFKGWALNLIGLIHPPSSKQHKFILVAIDYFTKWVEAIPSIEANGQVEAAYKILISLIKKKHIGNKPRTWHETLSQVLWAYRNSPRGSTGTSPYKLVYGHDAVLPLEINLNTLRISKQSNLLVDDYWNAIFDELSELDSERILALDNMIRQKASIARSYNHRIKEKSFNIGELVLKVILPMEKKLKFLGKWSHTWEGPFQVIGTYSGNAYLIKDIESERVINSINGKYLKQYYCWQN
ncbi:protein NYNRIN-like [Arachis ipaensis]|uniref:protein NYNRIN-like n=1 Tax=Arachis ipaensis TaxID=130454 RepID=UPI0007AF19F4|nr:protein NYNRIN-like [Arachis ipaensis]XP_025651936.1 protein NYNRIN-like [Arachis hypogaea]